MNIYKKNTNKYVLINLFRAKPFPDKVVNIVKKINRFMIVDEQTPSGGLSSCVFEGFSKNKFYPKIISKSLPDQYIFDNGGRNYLLKKYGLGETDILKSLKKLK